MKKLNSSWSYIRWYQVEDTFGDIIGEDSFNQDYITKLNNFPAKLI